MPVTSKFNARLLSLRYRYRPSSVCNIAIDRKLELKSRWKTGLRLLGRLPGRRIWQGRIKPLSVDRSLHCYR